MDIMELDLVICIDTTPSMEKCVRDLQANGETVTDSLFLEIEKLRIAVLAHNDYNEYEYNRGSVLTMEDFTDDSQKIQEFIYNIAIGHADKSRNHAECYELAIRAARKNLSWRKGSQKAMIMIGDSYPHTQQEYYEALMKNYSVTPLDWMAEVNMLLKLYLESGERGNKFWQTLSNMSNTEWTYIRKAKYTTTLLRDVALKAIGQSGFQGPDDAKARVYSSHFSNGPYDFMAPYSSASSFAGSTMDDNPSYKMECPPMSVTMKHEEIGYSKLGHKRPSKLRSSISHEEGFQPGTKLENLRQAEVPDVRWRNYDPRNQRVSTKSHDYTKVSNTHIVMEGSCTSSDSEDRVSAKRSGGSIRRRIRQYKPIIVNVYTCNGAHSTPPLHPTFTNTTNSNINRASDATIQQPPFTPVPPNRQQPPFHLPPTYQSVDNAQVIAGPVSQGIHEAQAQETAQRETLIDKEKITGMTLAVRDSFGRGVANQRKNEEQMRNAGHKSVDGGMMAQINAGAREAAGPTSDLLIGASEQMGDDKQC